MPEFSQDDNALRLPDNPEPQDNQSSGKPGLNRRQFLRGLGIAGAGSAVAGELIAPKEAESKPAPRDGEGTGTTLAKGTVPLTLHVNGQNVTMQVEPRTTLLNALRNHADPPITGPKLVCDQGACGGCTVMVNGKTVYGCMQLAVDMAGKKITTAEGLVKNGKPHPVQAAFVAHDAMMCGFCTPGFVTSLAALLDANPNPTHEEVQRACAGNICRCGTYPHIFEAALAAAKTMREAKGGA